MNPSHPYSPVLPSYLLATLVASPLKEDYEQYKLDLLFNHWSMVKLPTP